MKPPIAHLALVATALLAGSPLVAAEVTVVGPVFSQLVAFAAPDRFRPGFEDANADNYILELAPQGETVEQWSELITLTGTRGSSGDADGLAGFANLLAQGYAEACPDSFAAYQFDPPRVAGASAVFAGYMGCGAIGTQSEAMVFLVLAGKADLYTLQWAEHGAAVAAAPEPDLAHWMPRLDALAGAARICDPVAGEAAPYPSCRQ